MRQLKGKERKETKKEKRERRNDNVETRQKLMTVVLPTLLAFAAVIALYVYMYSRPKV